MPGRVAQMCLCHVSLVQLTAWPIASGQTEAAARCSVPAGTCPVICMTASNEGVGEWVIGFVVIGDWLCAG